MGKRVNFCARSVVTCDSYIAVDEIMVPQHIAARLTYPVVVHAWNHHLLTERMQSGHVLFLQRATTGGRMRSITHVAIQNYTTQSGDCLVRKGLKYPIHKPPLPCPEDVTLPIQCPGPTLCFGDRIRCKRTGALLDPLQTITWPTLQVGDTVLVTPRDGDWCLALASQCVVHWDAMRHESTANVGAALFLLIFCRTEVLKRSSQQKQMSKSPCWG
jgi:hypothetical protein